MQTSEGASGGEPVRVVAAVIRRGGDLLVCQRPLHKRHGGMWEFPGGKCEPGESDADALRREIREELGAEVTAVGEPEFEAADAGAPFLIVFVPVEIRGEPEVHEHVGLVWGTAEKVAGLPLAPSDERYVAYLLNCAGETAGGSAHAS
jgi:8-oxo-dGTP diphosphatase